MKKGSPDFEYNESDSSDDVLLSDLMSQHGNELTNLAYSYLHDWGQAEDVVQEVFVKCYQKLATFRGDSTYRTWLYRITINKCKDVKKSWAYRNLNVQPLDTLFSLSSEEETPEEAAFRQSENEQLAQVLLTLPIKYREVLFLHYYSDLKIDEIGQMLKKNDKTIRTRLFRARKLLKQKLEGDPTNGR